MASIDSQFPLTHRLWVTMTVISYLWCHCGVTSLIMTSLFLDILRCSIGITYLGYLGMFVPGISIQYINPPVFCTIPSSISIFVVPQQLRFTLNNLQPATSDSVSRYACVLPLRYIHFVALVPACASLWFLWLLWLNYDFSIESITARKIMITMAQL